MTEHMSVEQGRKALAKSRGKQPESAVVTQARDWLRFKGYDVTRHQQGLGSRRGFPDLTALRDGVTFYVECKTATGKLSEHQRQFQETCEAHGGRYLVVRCVEDLEAAL